MKDLQHKIITHRILPGPCGLTPVSRNHADFSNCGQITAISKCRDNCLVTEIAQGLYH